MYRVNSSHQSRAEKNYSSIYSSKKHHLTGWKHTITEQHNYNILQLGDTTKTHLENFYAMYPKVQSKLQYCSMSCPMWSSKSSDSSIPSDVSEGNSSSWFSNMTHDWRNSTQYWKVSMMWQWVFATKAAEDGNKWDEVVATFIVPSRQLLWQLGVFQLLQKGKNGCSYLRIVFGTQFRNNQRCGFTALVRHLAQLYAFCRDVISESHNGITNRSLRDTKWKWTRYVHKWLSSSVRGQFSTCFSTFLLSQKSTWTREPTGFSNPEEAKMPRTESTGQQILISF